MMVRVIAVLVWVAGILPLAAQNKMISSLHTGDTIYLSRDQLPAFLDLGETGDDEFWDMSRLLAPFVHQSLVRPDQNGGMIVSGPDDVDRYVKMKGDGLYLTALGLPDAVNGGTILAKYDPPVPYVTSESIGDTWTYTGTVNIQSPGRGEIQFNLTIFAEVDAQGEVNSPTARYPVLRERRDIDLVMTKGSGPVDLRWPVGFLPGRAYFFQCSAQPYPVAVVQTDAMDRAKQVEYLTHPWAGQVIQQLPQRPDVYVYPNPSFGNVRFDLLNLSSGYYDLEIYNILGMLVRTEHVFVSGSKTFPLDLSRLKKGTYIYRLVDSQKNTIKSKRLVIITP